MAAQEEEVTYQGYLVAAYNRRTGQIYAVDPVQTTEYKVNVQQQFEDEVRTKIIREDTNAMLGDVVVKVIPF